jgi:hypothetical protein
MRKYAADALRTGFGIVSYRASEVVVYGCIEKGKPAIEMGLADGQRGMLGKRVTSVGMLV